MAIGGMALAIRLREHWPEIILNETHPKVLFHARLGHRYKAKDLSSALASFLAHSGLRGQVGSEHELDALISAWTTKIGLHENWRDLVDGDENLLFPAGPVRYLWP
jgi:hypothetical protein